MTVRTASAVLAEVRGMEAQGIAQDRRENERHRARFGSVLDGSAREFWAPTLVSRYDNEQDVIVFQAVARACRAPGATPAQRWAIVERAIRELAMAYADGGGAK